MIDSTAIDDQKEWEDILFEETLEEIGMGTRITAGVVLGILAGAGINASGVLGYFDNPYHRYEFLGATGAALGYMGRRILDWAGEELASRAAKEARALTDEVQEAVAEGFANDRNFVALLKNLHDLSAKVEEIKGKRGKKFQAIRAAKKQAGLELKGYVSERAKTLVPPELQQKGVTFSAQRAADMAKDRIGENKMKFSKSEIKQIIKEEIQQYMDEIIDNNGVEIEEEGPSDEEHLLGLLAKEFDRIPSDRRKSVYTRFLSAANRYADKVSVATPESIPSLQEEFIKEANIGADFQNFLSSLGKVPQKKQKQLLQQLNNVVEKYVSNLEGGGGPVPTVSTDVDLDESLILEELNEVLIDENVLAKVGDFLLKKMGIAKDKTQEALGFIKQIMQAKKKYNLDMKSLEKLAQSQGSNSSLNENVYKIMPKPVATALAKANIGLMNAIGSKTTVRVLKALKIGVPVMMALAILTNAGDAFAGSSEAFDAMTQDPDFGKSGQKIVKIVRSASESGGDVAAGISGMDPELMASEGFMKKLGNAWQEMRALDKQGMPTDAYETTIKKFLGPEGFKLYNKYRLNGMTGQELQQDLLRQFGDNLNLTPEQVIKSLNTMPNKEKYFGSSGIKVIAKMLTGKMI